MAALVSGTDSQKVVVLVVVAGGGGWLLDGWKPVTARCCSRILHFLLHLCVHANPQTRAAQPTAGNKDNTVHP